MLLPTPHPYTYSLTPPHCSLPPTLLQVCPFSGMVLVGHAGGDVRVYQFTETPQQVGK